MRSTWSSGHVPAPPTTLPPTPAPAELLLHLGALTPTSSDVGLEKNRYHRPLDRWVTAQVS